MRGASPLPGHFSSPTMQSCTCNCVHATMPLSPSIRQAVAAPLTQPAFSPWHASQPARKGCGLALTLPEVELEMLALVLGPLLGEYQVLSASCWKAGKCGWAAGMRRTRSAWVVYFPSNAFKLAGLCVLHSITAPPASETDWPS